MFRRNEPERQWPAHRGALGRRDYRGFDQYGNPSFRAPGQSLFPWRGEDGSYGNLLDAHEFKGWGVAILLFEAKGDDLADALHEGIEFFGLGVAAAKGGNRGDVIAFLVLLDQNGEFPLRFHAKAL